MYCVNNQSYFQPASKAFDSHESMSDFGDLQCLRGSKTTGQTHKISGPSG